MDEYTVSVIALHDSYQGNNSPDYIASHFTGVAEKTQRNTMFVAPDACCGAVRHNSKVIQNLEQQKPWKQTVICPVN